MPMRRPVKQYLIVLGGYWAVWLVLLAGGYMLFLMPQAQVAAGVNKRLAEVVERHSHAQEARTSQTRQRLAEQLKQVQDRLAEFVVDSGVAAGVTFQIGQVADELAVSEFSTKRKETQEQETLDGCKNLAEVSLDVTFDSDFSKFARFINQMERLSPVVFVERFSIKRKIQDANQHETKMGLAFFVGTDKPLRES